MTLTAFEIVNTYKTQGAEVPYDMPFGVVVAVEPTTVLPSSYTR